MPTTAIIAAGIGAGGSILGAGIGAYAQTQAAGKAVSAEEAMYHQGLGWAQNMLTGAQNTLNPYISAGTNALTQYNAALPQLTAPFSAATLPSTPGYQFTLDQGLKSTQNSYAAMGLGSSGAAMKGAAGYATGLAQNTYNQQFGNYLAQNAQIGNLLFQPASLGAGSANTLAGVEGQLGAAGLGGAVQTGGNVGNAIMGGGNAIAGAAAGSANALTGGANTYLQYLMLSNLMNGGGLGSAATNYAANEDYMVNNLISGANYLNLPTGSIG